MHYTISFCTVCMNRLHHLQQTLIKNIEDNSSYSNVEFVVLDYNSTDGLEEWIKSEAKSYIEKGILKFYRTEEPHHFDRSHSRNVVFKLASGSLICNIDADNYTGKNFAHYINSVFSKGDSIFLVADTQKRFYFLRNVFGRFCVKKEDFIELGGLDEKMKSYGSETLDFYERLRLSGKKEVVIENISFLKSISHSDEERISNEFFLKNLKLFLIKYVSIEVSEILFLFNDNSFETGTIIPEERNNHLPCRLMPGTFQKGKWELENNNLFLLYSNGMQKNFLCSEVNFIDLKNGSLYVPIKDQRFIKQAAKDYSFIVNTDTFFENKREQLQAVNEKKFGQQTVYKNFSEKIIVQ